MRPSIIVLLATAASASIIRENIQRRQTEAPAQEDGATQAPIAPSQTSNIIPQSTFSTLTSLTSPSITPTITLSSTTKPHLVCSTTTLVSTTICSGSNGHTLCIPTSTPTAVCRSDLLCFANLPDGSESCKIRDNHVAPAGIAFITVVSVVLLIITVYLIMQFMKKRRARRSRNEMRVWSGGRKVRTFDGVQFEFGPYCGTDPTRGGRRDMDEKMREVRGSEDSEEQFSLMGRKSVDTQYSPPPPTYSEAQWKENRRAGIVDGELRMNPIPSEPVVGEFRANIIPPTPTTP